MNYWVFTVTTHKEGGETFEAAAIHAQRMKDAFWGLGEKTPNRKGLQNGDRVVFYMGAPDKTFIGAATLASSSLKLSESQKKQYGHGKAFYMPEYGVLLEDIETWSQPRPVEGLVPDLDFIENKEFWFTYFQGGIRQITLEDFLRISTGGLSTLVERISKTKDLESESEFALEAHLEEFIAENWNRIGWGRKLRLYESDEQTGRQYPAGPWSIDFLAVDEQSNDLVIIELKRGKTSDAAVGQLLRYMSWIRENLAEKGQRVRGILVAHAVDEALEYAVKGLPDMEVNTYKVDFQLVPFKK
jgi:hypothetical protein